MNGLRQEAMIREPQVREVNANNLLGLEVSTVATGSIDLYPGQHPMVLSLTTNRSGAISVGLNTAGARRKDRARIVSNQASPGAFAITVKTGTAAGGTSIGTISSSKNGFLEAQFDGTNWVFVGKSEY